MNLQLENKSCVLCDQKVSGSPIVDGDNLFCCMGCEAVYNILSVRQEMDQYQETPLFQQAVQSGLISNPDLLEQIRQKQVSVPESEIKTLHLDVQEMWCPSCAEIIRLRLLQEKGIKNCVVDYSTDLASVEYAPRYISKERIFEIIKNLGYSASLLESAERKAVSLGLYLRFIVAAFFSLNVMMFSYPVYAGYFFPDEGGNSHLFAWITFFASLPVLGYSAWPIFRRFVSSIQVGILGMETLIVLGVSASFGLSTHELFHGGNHIYFDSMSLIITFVLLGKILESKAKFSAKDSIIRLSRAVPKRGRKRLQDNREVYVPIKEITPGDIVVAFTGEKIVLDGVVIEGEGTCNESLMTGEAIPVKKQKDATVLGGTIVSNGWVAYRVTATVEETALHQIISMVEKDIGNKSVYTRTVDPIVRGFVPVIILIALLTGIGFWIIHGNTEAAVIRAVTVLLISCPCAIGIAAPLAESKMMSGFANLGAIVRNRGCLSKMGKETVFVFDKTGTVTEGFFHVLSGVEKLTERERSILKGLASQSNHPIATAISQNILDLTQKLENVKEIAGKGMTGMLNGHVYWLGSRQFMKSHGIEVDNSPTLESDGIVTTVYFAVNKRLLGKLTLGDQIRSQAKETVEALAPMKRVLLSGDGESSVKAVAKTCHFDEWYAEYNPLQKRDYIDRLRKRGEVVCMMGDGINDAPAITGSDIGISVVNATDVSIQVSDILLTTDRLGVLLKIRELARKGHRIVKQNLFWAFFYNLIGVGLAVCGYLTPIFSAVAMVLSSLIVLFNAKRI